MQASVIICAHNPTPGYLTRVLSALSVQTLARDKWELLIVDNASDRRLEQDYDVSWHHQAKHIREDAVGLINARLAGIRNALGDLLIFVDDDNILAEDYLQTAVAIGEDWPILGAWGGQVVGEFEIEPPEWARPYYSYLALAETDQNQWSNMKYENATTPVGAGMCVRRQVAEAYYSGVKSDPRRLALGRNGASLASGEDLDMAFHACDMGLGCGRFTSLKMKHLIPANRLEEDYLVRLVREITYSDALLHGIRGDAVSAYVDCRRGFLHRCLRWWRLTPRDRRFFYARQEGMLAGLKAISEVRLEPEKSAANKALQGIMPGQ